MKGGILAVVQPFKDDRAIILSYLYDLSVKGPIERGLSSPLSGGVTVGHFQGNPQSKGLVYLACGTKERV